MKTKVEINGVEITIEDVEGKIEVKAEMNDDVVEELTIDPAEYGDAEGEEAEEAEAFGEEGAEADEAEGTEDMHEEGSEEEEEMMGESVKTFNAFFEKSEKKKKKK